MVSDRRILFVHAHPDDETLINGATMARYAAEGVRVTLVTCTLGEEGEVFVPTLAGLGADQSDQLGGYRLAELQRACQALGVIDFRLLGGAGRYRDSGMLGTSPNQNPRCFWRTNLTEPAALLSQIIAELRPQVVVTYDPNGLYGHPDHIQTHRAAMAGVQQAATDGHWRVPRVVWGAIPHSLAAAGLSHLLASTHNPFANAHSVSDLPFITDDSQLMFRIDATAYAQHKRVAMAAHATQIVPDSWLTVIAENFWQEPLGVEYYQLAPGYSSPIPQAPTASSVTSLKLAADLFAGLE